MSVINDQLRDCLSQLDICKTIYVAYSGGIDSTVLLHAAYEQCSLLGRSLKAIHINHQIHHDALLWSQHCVDQCHAIGIDIEVIDVDVKQFSQHGIEGAAREARYKAFTNILTNHDALLTAHHADDQIETVLLQLFRGAGVHGLAACAHTRELGDSLLMRPLLQVSRAQIEHYAQIHQLNWLEDPSNHSLVHDRNYLRHQVMPLLHSRWHNLHEIASRVTQWQSEAAHMLDQLADDDLQIALDEHQRLNIESIQALDYSRKKNLLRRWVRRQNCHVPNADILARIIYEVIHSRDDAQACVQWQNYQVRKYRGKLYLLTDWLPHDSTQRYRWDLNQALNITSLNMTLTKQALLDFGVKLTGVDQLEVRFRQGGEIMRPHGRGCQKDLKSLFQEASIEPWQRDRIPLLFHHEQLVFVWGYWRHEGY